MLLLTLMCVTNKTFHFIPLKLNLFATAKKNVIAAHTPFMAMLCVLITFCSFSIVVVHLGPGEDRSEDGIMMNTPVVKSALEMGFERNLVKQTVQSKILSSGENYKTVQELVCDLLSAEDEKREEEREMFAEEMASGLSSS